MDILRDKASSTLKISQEGYIKKIVDIFGQSHAKIVSSPIGAQNLAQIPQYRRKGNRR